MANRFNQMRAFVGVVEAGGFTSATARTGMSRAVISRNIIDLEDRLGTRLLNRTTRQVSLTDVGRSFYEKCRRILDELDDAERIATNSQSGPQGELRVVAPINFGLGELGSGITKFLLAYESIRVLLSLNDHPVDPIESGYDIAIRVLQRPIQPPQTIDMCKIAVSSRILCASPAYLDMRGEPSRPQDLARHDCLCYSYVDEPGVWQFTRGKDEFAVPVRARVTTSASSVLATSAAEGLGIAYGPRAFFHKELASGAVRQVLSDYRLPEVSIFSLFARSRHPSRKVEAFNEFMQANLYRGTR
ncbi:MAG: LysR family transcriptional regulator [Hyphomicrobiales bacterium]|nr:LysR family transcriptional regulator [Hyphomicrobiales bacterium]